MRRQARPLPRFSFRQKKGKTMSDLLQTLQWRYATKKFNPAKRVPQEKIDRILEAIRLTATSSGLQP